jgi:hypothetical protein
LLLISTYQNERTHPPAIRGKITTDSFSWS